MAHPTQILLLLSYFKPHKQGRKKTDKKLHYTVKKKIKFQMFLIYQEIQNGAVAKSHMRKGFLIYEEMHIYLVI